MTFASGYQSVYQAMLLLLLGLPLYAFLKARRERLGQVDEPVDMPPELRRVLRGLTAMVLLPCSSLTAPGVPGC